MGKQVRTIEFEPPGTVKTASYNTPETSEVLSDGPGVMYLDVTAAGGTSPTLDIDLEAKDPVSGVWFTVVSFIQKTAAGTQRLSSGLQDMPDAVYRCAITITGSAGQTFTFSLSFVMKDRG